MFEPYHAVTYFAPEAREEFARAGLRGFWRGYFAGRFSPLGAPDAAVVTDIAFVFTPTMVERAIPNVWELCTPHDALEARLRGVERALGWLDVPNAVAERVCAVAERCDGADRPLARANLSVGWPDEPMLALWQATTVLREHRGDGHVIALREAELGGCEALVLHSATGLPEPVHLRDNRGWTNEDWNAASEQLAARGWLDGSGAITDAGEHARAAIESRTDDLASPPYVRFGLDGLVEALRPITEQVIGRGVIPYPNPMGVPRP